MQTFDTGKTGTSLRSGSAFKDKVLNIDTVAGILVQNGVIAAPENTASDTFTDYVSEYRYKCTWGDTWGECVSKEEAMAVIHSETMASIMGTNLLVINWV